MIRLAKEQFEELKRHTNPEVYTEAQMSAWLESLSDTLIKSEFSELDEVEKAVVIEFNEEIQSFIRVEVISPPEANDLQKSLKYDTLYIREQQIEWSDIEKSEGEEGSKSGVYKNTELNRKLGRVGCVYGATVEKSEETDIEKGGEGSKGGKIVGHTKSGKPIYDAGHLKTNADYDMHRERTKDYSKEDHSDAANLHKEKEGFHSEEANKKREEGKHSAKEKHNKLRGDHFSARRFHEAGAKAED